MASAAVRRGAFVALFALSTACSDSRQPAALLPTGPTASPPPFSGFPPVSSPAEIYAFARALTYPVRGWTQNSRFVLYADGTFELQYLSGFPYRGTYEQAGPVIAFRWAGSVPAGKVGATGTRRNDFVEVDFDDQMEHSDFEDAIYIRTQ